MTDSALRIFLTGGTGYVGSAVARRLLARGHQVTALVRDPERAAALPAGCAPLVGDLASPAGWLEAAAAAHVAVHAGFQYADGAEELAPDWIATAALLALAESGAGRLRRVVYTSNAYLLGDHAAEPVDERAHPLAPSGSLSRPALERVVARSGCAAVVRLGMVYGAAGGAMGGTIPPLLDRLAAGEPLGALERLEGRWSLVHLADVTELYRTLVEAEPGVAGVFHATDGTPLRVAEVLALARAALSSAGVPLVARPARDEHALRDDHLGRLARDVAVVPRRSLALGWRPRCPSFRDGALQTALEWRAARGLA